MQYYKSRDVKMFDKKKWKKEEKTFRAYEKN